MQGQCKIEILSDNEGYSQAELTTSSETSIKGNLWALKEYAQMEGETMKKIYLQGKLDAYSEIDLLRIKTLRNITKYE